MYDLDTLKKKKLLTRKEAAFYIGVSPTTMQNIMHSDGFPAYVKVSPNRVFVNREIFDKWIDSQTGKKS